MEELRQQLQSDPGDAMASDVTAAQVAEAAESERLNITLASGVMSRLKQQALAEGRKIYYTNGKMIFFWKIYDKKQHKGIFSRVLCPSVRLYKICLEEWPF